MRHSRINSIRLKRFHRYFLYVVFAVLFLSGVVWACFNYLPQNVDFSDAKSLSLKIHGAAAMATLVLIGGILTTHVRFAWRARRNRNNGIWFIGVLGILTVTGYLLYYAGNERLRLWTSWSHLAFGLALPVLLIAHIWLGRRTRGNSP